MTNNSPIGNCQLETLIKALHNGFKVKKIYYRATMDYRPIYMNQHELPFMTQWLYWEPGMDGTKHVSIEKLPYGNSGWNTVYLEKDNNSSISKVINDE